MKFDSDDIKHLEPVIAATVRVVLAETADREQKVNGRLGYTEPEAAAAIGIAPHVLRDARLRGEIHARKCGKRYLYSHQSLIDFLAEAHQ